jgi:hypothetical protein
MLGRMGSYTGSDRSTLITAKEPVSAGNSAGDRPADHSKNTLPAPTASNKRRRDAQDAAEDQRPAQRRATTSVTPLTADAPLAPLALGPTPTIERSVCQTAAPPTHSTGNGEKNNRAGKRVGWSQARQHHKNNCKLF